MSHPYRMNDLGEGRPEGASPGLDNGSRGTLARGKPTCSVRRLGSLGFLFAFDFLFEDADEVT